MNFATFRNGETHRGGNQGGGGNREYKLLEAGNSDSSDTPPVIGLIYPDFLLFWSVWRMDWALDLIFKFFRNFLLLLPLHLQPERAEN